jgi:HEAT repeat protein
MGLFDFLSGKKSQENSPKKPSQREFNRYARLVSEKMSQNYDRQEAIEVLAAQGTAESAAALLKRFSWTMEPSITDQEEKQAAVQGIVAAGDAALDPLRVYAVRAESLTWPLKVLRQIVAEEDIVDELLGLLDEFDTEYVRNIEPKRQLLAMLEEYPSPEVRQGVEPFLTDISEPIRFAAVTTTFAMGDETCIAALAEALAEEESLRVRNRIAQGLVERRWKIPEDLRELFAGALPPDFRLQGDVIRRVGTSGG